MLCRLQQWQLVQHAASIMFNRLPAFACGSAYQKDDSELKLHFTHGSALLSTGQAFEPTTAQVCCHELTSYCLSVSSKKVPALQLLGLSSSKLPSMTSCRAG
jgi:hypothetical protein